jgi:oxygen-independent coproporphyrinogen III oxidase
MVWTYHPELLETPVPRYTSFPTAAEFREDVAPDDMIEAIGGIAGRAVISLYVHIPYCREICWYCGCNTGAANRAHRLASYLERLEQEIELYARYLDPLVRVGRIAFGGGSPNAISPQQFDRLVDVLKGAFDCRETVISVEIDPRGFDASWADALKRHRVSRVSLGVQTLSPALQAAIGRVQPWAMIDESVTLLRSAGVDSINFDLMYGLPGQTDADIEATILGCLDLAPDRLAVFGYAHVPSMLPRQRRIDVSALRDTATRFAHAAFAHDLLTVSGYEAIGFDHFAQPHDALAIAAEAGTLRRNFQGFTEDRADVLLGIGASAISAFNDRLLQNEKNTGRWGMSVAAGLFAVSRGLRRTPDDQRRARAIESLLCRGHADLSALNMTYLRRRLSRFEAHGLIWWEGVTLHISEDAPPYIRAIAAALDPYRQQSAIAFSSAI